MVRASLALLGRRPCLDFVNTVDPREPFGEDHLPDYSGLLAWSKRTSLLEQSELRQVAAAAAQSPAGAARAHRGAIDLRETLYPVLCAAADGRRPPVRAASRFATIAEAFERRRRLEWVSGSWCWTTTPVDMLDLPALAILEDGLDVLTSDAVQHVAKCNGDPCGWLFLDRSKNHSRRWCSMASCGNRAKTRRHYERHRARAT